MVSRQLIVLSLLVGYAGSSYGFGDLTWQGWRKTEDKRLSRAVSQPIKPEPAAQKLILEEDISRRKKRERYNRKLEELSSQKEQLNKDLDPYKKRVQALKQRGEVNRNLPTRIYFEQDSKGLKILRESAEDSMKRECGSWWPWNKCADYRKNFEGIDREWNIYKNYDAKYKALDGVKQQIQDLEAKKKAL